MRSTPNRLTSFTSPPTSRVSAAVVAAGLYVGLSLSLMSACASPDAGRDDGAVGTVSLALADGAGTHFRLRMFDGPVSGTQLFDTGCVEATSNTYQLQNIPVGDNHTVFIQGYSAADCNDAALVETGLRGQVRVATGDNPYFFIPIYPVRAVSSLPEGLNVSGSTAQQVDFCGVDTDCADDGSQLCYTGIVNEFWCVPICAQDSDCTSIHPQATCDTRDAFCKIHNPYPLNLSEPRAFGAAFAMGSGDIVFVGGYGALGQDGVLRAGRYLLEGFSKDTGIFTALDANGADPWAAGMFGSARLGQNRIVMVGGARELKLNWDGQSLTAAGTDWATSLSGDVVILDPAAGTATKASDALRGVAQPAVVALDDRRFLVAGGLIHEGAISATRDAWLCEVDDAGLPSCRGTGHLNTERFAAAGECLDAECSQVLIFGGAGGGPLAERYDVATGQFTALSATGLPARVFDPVLCGGGSLALLGGSIEAGTPGALLPATLAVRGDELIGTPIPSADGATTTLYGTTAKGAMGCFSFGGLAPDRTLSDQISLFDGATFGQPTYNLTRSRFGAVSAAIGSGPLAGLLLVGGGLALPQTTGTPALVSGVEVLSP